MQQVRLWEVTPDEKLTPIPNNGISLEERLEGWLANDISVLDPNLLVIGRQVPTEFGGTIDLLCLNSVGDTVVVELKKGKTPREVAAQALDYASWVRGLSPDEITRIADAYLGDSGQLKLAFQQQFETMLPDVLNQDHSSLIVAESIDASTERIVRYLSSMDVPINVATVQHFKDKDGRTILAQVYLIDPEEVEINKPRLTLRRVISATVKDLQDMADRSGIGVLFGQIKSGVRGVLSAQVYIDRMWYRLQRDDGGVRTVLIVYATAHEESGGLQFTMHATRLKEQLGIDLETLRTWLPQTSHEVDLSGWPGSSESERKCAVGLGGYLQNPEEVDRFVGALRNAITQSRAT